jgi:hypothetical protein
MQGFGYGFHPTRQRRGGVHSHDDQISRCNAIEAERVAFVDALAAQFGEELVASARAALRTHDMRQVDAELRKIGHAP